MSTTSRPPAAVSSSPRSLLQCLGHWLPGKMWLIKTANYDDGSEQNSVIGTSLRLSAIAAAGHWHARRLGDGAASQNEEPAKGVPTRNRAGLRCFINLSL